MFGSSLFLEMRQALVFFAPSFRREKKANLSMKLPLTACIISNGNLMAVKVCWDNLCVHGNGISVDRASNRAPDSKHTIYLRFTLK